MNTENYVFPPLAQTHARPRQAARAWPCAPRPAELSLPAARCADAGHDFLRILPEPALTCELPAAPPPQLPKILPPVPGAGAARTYWFDL